MRVTYRVRFVQRCELLYRRQLRYEHDHALEERREFHAPDRVGAGVALITRQCLPELAHGPVEHVNRVHVSE